MTLKLNTFTGTWINEKLMKQAHNAKAARYMNFKKGALDRIWEAVDANMLNEDSAFMMETVMDDTDDIEVIMSQVAQIAPHYDEFFEAYVIAWTKRNEKGL